jgi:IS5 family transposase
VALGRTPRQTDLLRSTVDYCADRVASDSIYAILHRECLTLFPDEMFADLFTDIGRRSVPPMIVAVVMVLQRIEGLSDREAVGRFAFDARWKYAAGGLDFDYPGFVHTVLVDMRARLARSQRPDRIFQVTLDVAGQAGLVERRRVLDSTPIYDAVATMDTITLIRSAIRGLLAATDTDLAAVLRAALTSGDDYASTAKPQIDWDDAAARQELVDSRARDGFALLALLEGRELDPRVEQAARLLATVLGQDLTDGGDGCFRIARKVATDRVISTVDPQARHGHKTSARGFDGYKGHLATDPDSEIITATTVTPGNSGDAEVAQSLLADILPSEAEAEAEADTRPAVYGDAAYGAGELLARLDNNGVYNGLKVQPPARITGHYGKDSFTIDLDAKTVTCPAGVVAGIRAHGGRHAGTAEFGAACADCPLRDGCTTAKAGRTIAISPHEVHLAAGRARQLDPFWKADYRATRPKVERKIAHLMRRRHGGRRARVRGVVKVAADFSLLAAAVNLARLGRLGLASAAGRWTMAIA